MVGSAPGRSTSCTPAARAAVEEAEVVLGYRTYLDLVAPLLDGKEVVRPG